jgi:lauroyl/myristoyl acyltransferase
LAYAIALFQLLLLPRRAAAHQSNIKRALRENRRGRLARWSLTLKALVSYGYFLLEYFKTHSLEDDRLLSRFSFQGLECVDEALGLGRGVILVAVHLGNWWAGARALAVAGYNVHIVAGVQFTEGLSRHAKAAHEDSGLHIVSPGPGRYRNLITALRDNEVIALPVDGDTFERGLKVPFFSEHIAAPPGPARLAAMTGAAVIACRVIRTGPMKYGFEFKTVWEGCAPHNRPDVDAAHPSRERESAMSRRGAHFVMDLTIAVMNEQEKAIRANLGQWCIFRNLWPNSGGSE